ncbi:response regulator [bacterium]|nr:response regulator [bacterium]
MNGNISVESEKGKGTTFTVTVTLGEAGGKEREDATGNPSDCRLSGGGKTDLKGRRILLAEDVAVNAEIVKMILGMRGMEIDLAENGKIAVDMFASHEAGYYSAILMDMRMPVMDGLEAAKAVRAMERGDAKTIPVIALTANAFDDDVQRSLNAGLNAHLSKPIEPEALFETLEKLVV